MKETLSQMGLSAKEIQQFYRRMVFNVLAVNQDDHVKNISFLMDRNGKWCLSPAYDITFAYNPENKWLRQHQMLINNKMNNINYSDLLEAGKNMEIKEATCKKIINDVKTVVDKFETYAAKAGINKEKISAIKTCLKKSFLFNPDGV